MEGDLYEGWMGECMVLARYLLLSRTFGGVEEGKTGLRGDRLLSWLRHSHGCSTLPLPLQSSFPPSDWCNYQLEYPTAPYEPPAYHMQNGNSRPRPITELQARQRTSQARHTTETGIFTWEPTLKGTSSGTTVMDSMPLSRREHRLSMPRIMCQSIADEV